MTRALLLLATLTLSACELSSTGGGTGQLYVAAHLTGDGSSAASRALITVRDGSDDGERLDDVEVVLRGGELPPTRVPWNEDTRDYRLSDFRWVPAMRLEVRRGDAWLDGQLDVPGATLIANPLPGATFRKADAPSLLVQWKDERGVFAHTTVIHVQRAGVDRELPAGALETALSADELTSTSDERIRIERRNEVGLLGGARGSRLTAGTENAVTFNVE